MDFLALAKQRCSVRKYKKVAVEDVKLEKILEAAHVAPTAANMQPQQLLVIQSPTALAKLEKGVGYHGAPLAIIVCGDKQSVWTRPFDNKDMIDVDCTIVADHIVMEAEDLGLSTCWLTYFDPAAIKSEFNIPQNFVPVAIIAVGYSAVEKESSTRHGQMRKPLSSMVTYDTF